MFTSNNLKFQKNQHYLSKYYTYQVVFFFFVTLYSIFVFFKQSNQKYQDIN